MWVIVMFDLPVDTSEARREYALFRKSLLEDGYQMFQYSVYGRCCISHEKAEVVQTRVAANLPPDGEVRVLQITDKQLEQMKIFGGKLRKPVPHAPRQLEMF
jgi:CRISPR-associated protein Cas2